MPRFEALIRKMGLEAVKGSQRGELRRRDPFVLYCEAHR